MSRSTMLWVLAALAAAGFPGLAGFVGQLLVVLGAYPGHRLATPLALLGVLMVAGVLIWSIQRIFFVPAAEHLSRVRDLGTLELANGVGLLSLIVLLVSSLAILLACVTCSALSMRSL